MPLGPLAVRFMPFVGFPWRKGGWVTQRKRRDRVATIGMGPRSAAEGMKSKPAVTAKAATASTGRNNRRIK